VPQREPDSYEQLVAALESDPDVEVYHHPDSANVDIYPRSDMLRDLQADVRYAGQAVGSTVGGSLGSIASQMLSEHRTTALVIGVTAGTAIGIATAFRVVPRTFGIGTAWMTVALLMSGSGLIVAAAIVHALRDPRLRGMT
jgi:hypothetical protein